MSIWMQEMWRSWRGSLRRPGFVLLATGVLALGVGASAAVFTLIRQTLLRPLPVPQAARLVALGPIEDGEVAEASPYQYQHLQGLHGVKSIGLMELSMPSANIAGGGKPVQVPVTYVDRSLLPTLGLHMQLGRNFSAREDAPHGPKAVILSHGLWLRRFGGDPKVIGSSMQVEGVPHTIVGVLPAAFDAVGSGGAIVLPMALTSGTSEDGTNDVAIARLDDGVTPAAVAAQVNARLHAVYESLGDSYWYAKYWRRAHFGAEHLDRWMHSDDRPVLTLFLGSALFVLLIALVNLTNLMLMRALSRQHPSAVRSALGASRWRLALPSLAEGLLIGVAGALAGMLLATAGLELLRSAIPADWLPGAELHFGAVTWAMTFAVSVPGALLATLLGLWRGRAAGSLDELREGGRSGLGLRSGRLGRVLVVAQVTLATALLCAAGVFLHTLYNAARIPLGYASTGILTAELAPVKADYPDAAAVQQLSRRLVARLQAIPGVDRAVVTTNLPGGQRSGQFNLGGLHVPGGDAFNAQYHGVGVGFFKLFDITMRRGRAFNRGDVRGGEAVAIVSQSLARHRYGGHALGKLIQRGKGKYLWSARIVGVVADTRQFGPLRSAPEVIYLPLAQMPDSTMAIFRSFEPMRVALRVHGDPDGYRSALRRAVHAVAPMQPVAHLRSMRAVVHSTMASMRLNLLLVGIFATLSLLLAGAGLYAVMAVAVAAREREFGVRTALGASPTRLIRLVLRSGLWQIVIGLVLGAALSLSLSGILRAVMVQIQSTAAFDPLAIVGVCVLLIAAGVLACLLPALRAGRVQPMHALRGD